jgi:DNA polymerase-3 subunit beta
MATATLPEFTVSRLALLNEISTAQSVTERKTTVPILSNILLQAEEGAVVISATDLESALDTFCPAKVKEFGAVTVPARKFYDYLRLLAGEEVKIKALENGWVQIQCGRSKTKMVGITAKSFPKIESFPTEGILPMPVASFKALLARTTFAISREESRHTLNGALLEVHPNALVMVATDGHRLAYAKQTTYKSGLEQKKSYLIPRAGIQHVAKLLNEIKEETFQFAATESTLFFKLEKRTYSVRKLSGQFPNYGAVLPQENRKSVILPVRDLGNSIARVAQFADEKSSCVRLSLDANQLRVSSSSSEAGESEDIMDAPYADVPIVAGYNSAYLLDPLGVIGSLEVRLEFKDSSSPLQIRPEPIDGDLDYRVIVMGLRT